MVQAINMEDYFTPGFKTKPAVHVGSQTLPLFYGNAKEQAWEGFHLVSASAQDVAVVRDIDPEYITYWRSLMGDVSVINIMRSDSREYLSKIILNDSKIISDIKRKMSNKSHLMVFLPTQLEKQLAQKLNIPLHGKPEITTHWGTKSGIRKLAKEYDISMPKGFICSRLKEVKQAIAVLRNHFMEIVIKHDDSVSGLFSKRIKCKDVSDIKTTLSELIHSKFQDGHDTFVVEGWVNSSASLCAHIEILKNQKPVICAAWQQLFDKDGISHIGSRPLELSSLAMDSFIKTVNKLAFALQQKGAIGSFGPDFIITAENKLSIESDACMLVELNARVPYTALFLEAVVQVKGVIGTGFTSTHVSVSKKTNFRDIKEVLQKEKLLITKKSKKATGVIPFNTGLLKWNLFDVGIIASSWEEAQRIRKKIKTLFA